MNQKLIIDELIKRIINKKERLLQIRQGVDRQHGDNTPFVTGNLEIAEGCSPYFKEKLLQHIEQEGQQREYVRITGINSPFVKITR